MALPNTKIRESERWDSCCSPCAKCWCDQASQDTRKGLLILILRGLVPNVFIEMHTSYWEDLATIFAFAPLLVHFMFFASLGLPLSPTFGVMIGFPFCIFHCHIREAGRCPQWDRAQSKAMHNKGDLCPLPFCAVLWNLELISPIVEVW